MLDCKYNTGYETILKRFNEKKRIKKLNKNGGSGGNRTRGLSHPKRESYH